MKAIQKLGMTHLDTLGPRARQVAEYVMEHPDANQKQIGLALGIKPARMSKIVRNNRYLASMPHLARVLIKNMVPKAMKRYGELMSQKENLEVSRKVTERVLDTNKILDPEIRVNVNVFAEYKDDDLRRIVDQNTTVHSQAIESSIVDDGA